MSDAETRHWLREEVLPRLQRAGIRLVEAPTDEQLRALEGLYRETKESSWDWLYDWLRAAGLCLRRCKICEAPCRAGVIEHGRGCFHVSPDGGGSEGCPDCP